MALLVSQTALSGVLLVEPDVYRDERGFFLESYRRDRWSEAGIAAEFVQDNHSRSARNVLRGIHFQDERAPMGKLVRCTRGAILDVAVDLRVGSPTLGRWVAERLDEENMRQLMVPSGFGHAFLALTDGAEVQYKCTGYYAVEAEGAVRWDDPDLGIEWPVAEPIVSAKDAQAPSFREYLESPAFGCGS